MNTFKEFINERIRLSVQRAIDIADRDGYAPIADGWILQTNEKFKLDFGKEYHMFKEYEYYLVPDVGEIIGVNNAKELHKHYKFIHNNDGKRFQ